MSFGAFYRPYRPLCVVGATHWYCLGTLLVWCWYGLVLVLRWPKEGDFWGDSWGDSFWDCAVISMGWVPEKARSLGVSRAAGDSQVQLVLCDGIFQAQITGIEGLHQMRITA
jgi:hypothetical protein